MSIPTEAPVISVPLCGGGTLVEATFVARPNRFLVEATLSDGTLVQAHLADRGRLIELLVPDAPLLLAEKPGAGRKTSHQVAGVFSGSELVSLDTHLPNRLMEQALRERALQPFAAYDQVRREVRHGSSRFDFLLQDAEGERCFVEIKSANMLVDGIGRFPDAPSERGRRHIMELLEIKRSGVRAAVVFCVGRGDARAVGAHAGIDPAFAATLAEVAAAGLEVYGYRCPLSRSGITLGEQIPVLFDGR